MEDPERERVEEARADEAALVAARRRERTVAAVLAEAMAAGDHLTVRCGGSGVSGIVVAVAGDHAVVVSDERRAVVHLGGPIVVERRPAARGGTRGDRSHGSLRARLGTLELIGEPVEVVHAHGTARGRVLAVAVDHLLVDADGVEVVVPFVGLGYVVE